MTEMFHADKDYKANIIDSIDRAEKRVLLETMNLDDVGEMQHVVSSVKAARERDVDVRVIYDWYSYPSIALGHGVSALNAFKRTLKELKDSGVTLYEVGEKKANPFAGRHHAKATIADDVVYTGGGVNLSHVSFETKDFMFRYEDSELADKLFAELPEAAVNRPDDYVIHVNDECKVLLDGGQEGKSLIYEETCAMAENSSRAWYVSKLAPDGRLLDILKTKDTQYWFNTLKSATLLDKVALTIDQAKNGVPNSYGLGEVLHAKFCVFEDREGELSAISGSHNFNSRGVRYGTQELAVVTFDQSVCRDMIKFAETLSPHLPVVEQPLIRR